MISVNSPVYQRFVTLTGSVSREIVVSAGKHPSSGNLFVRPSRNHATSVPEPKYTVGLACPPLVPAYATILDSVSVNVMMG